MDIFIGLEHVVASTDALNLLVIVLSLFGTFIAPLKVPIGLFGFALRLFLWWRSKRRKKMYSEAEG